MPRLNQAAYDLLAAEVKRLSAANPALNVQRELTLKRLLRLCHQQGTPVTAAEIEAQLDLLPKFDPKVIARAARLNGAAGASGAWGVVGGAFANLAIAGGVISALVGGVWLANLPYPMIRWPVSKVAPMLLLPSFMEMDRHYRLATSLVEQSDQLVNRATGAADIKLGKEKVTAAQKSLDKLPVWFLGYFPQRYCTMFSCSWQFTLDEFEGARKQIGRMEAKVFQEEQALGKLDTATESLANAKSLYATVPNQVEAIALWQSAVDSLTQIPPETLAGRLAQTQLIAEQRDFGHMANTAAGSAESRKMLQAARNHAKLAVETAQNPPHLVEVWEKSVGQWRAAIAELETISRENPSYLDAQALKAQYQDQLGDIQIRLQQEQRSTQAFDQAQSEYVNLVASSDPTRPGGADRAAYRAKLQRIFDLLSKVQNGTTAYPKAQAMQKELTN
ncbi:MAG: hypothetical protein HC857_02420 [Synechococcales cyanobacterium RU_4_20]|nr:hypothetical protein [Synechococcales cyanobacterium RU_4_20]NJR70622.1 hypothetical protein [Synechococcales cyanobacterium CRU_2_2]